MTKLSSAAHGSKCENKPVHCRSGSGVIIGVNSCKKLKPMVAGRCGEETSGRLRIGDANRSALKRLAP